MSREKPNEETSFPQKKKKQQSEDRARFIIDQCPHKITGEVNLPWGQLLSPAGVKVQDLGYRWGSCGKGNWLYFHWKTILLPARIAEYVVVHEIAHLHEPHHTPAYWLRVERAMPDYAQRRAWLAEHGIDVEGI